MISDRLEEWLENNNWVIECVYMDIEQYRDLVMDTLDELRISEETVASLGEIEVDDVRLDSGRVSHEVLDSQAYVNKAIEALDRAFSILEEELE